jgi:predicted small secreted protein
MIRKLMTVALIGGVMAIAACNTVRGAGEDLGSAANTTENEINNYN